MRRISRDARVFGLLVFCSLIMVCSCGKKTCEVEDGNSPSYHSAQEVLEVYVASCLAEDIDAYSSCLGESYRFIFLADVADSLGLPPSQPWWDKEKDVAAMTNLFGDERVSWEQFDYVIQSTDTLSKADSMIVKMRIRPDMAIRIQSGQTEPIYILIKQSYLDFRFASTAASLDDWIMVETSEERVGLEAPVPRPGQAAGGSFTYSELKAMFR